MWACLGSNLLLYGGTCCSLVALWSWTKGFPLAFAWWEVCLLVSHQVNLGCLGITWYLIYVLCSCCQYLHFLCKLSNLACRKLVRINTTVIDGLWCKFISRKTTKDVMMQDVCSFLRIFSKTDWSMYSIVQLIHWFIALMEAFKQVKPGSNFIGLWLAKFIILGPDCILVYSSSWQAPGNILIHTKVTTPWYNFFAFLWLGEHCKLTM